MCIEEFGVHRGVWCIDRSVVRVGECGVYRECGACRGVWCV